MSGFLPELDLSANRLEVARRQAAARGYIDLTSSNPTHQGLRFPERILRAAADGYWQARRYDPDPRGLPAAREAVSRYYAQRAGVAPADAFCTASTSEAYSLLFALLAEPGDNLLAPDVTYPLFDYLAAMHRIELRLYHLEEERGWRIDPISLKVQADRRTRGVLIVSPHNPTGMVVSQPQPALDALGLPVVCDEVFAEFPYGLARVPALAALHPGLPVFTLNGISKLFALPDLKLGWIALNAPAAGRYSERLELLNDTFLGASTLIQAMLPALFERGWEFVEEMRARIRSNLDLALSALASCPRLRARPPDGGYYLFPRALECDDEEQLALALLEQGVLAHPGYFYGCEPEQGTGHLMISCLTEPGALRAGVEVLTRFLGRRA
jgi:aspartate/methionine/tyrosine aminotransferase